MATDRMTTEEVKARKRYLLRQCDDLIRTKNEVEINRALTKIRSYYQGQIGKNFDPVLSLKLDCLNVLLEK